MPKSKGYVTVREWLRVCKTGKHIEYELEQYGGIAMEKRSLNKMVFAGTVFAGGILLFKSIQKKNGKRVWVYEDNDMRNSVTVDREESVDAKYDDAEIGLTQLDSTFRSEWQANGFPQTHRELEKLEQSTSIESVRRK